MIPTALCLPLLKQVQGVPVTLSDLQFLDPSLFKSLKWIRDNTGVDALGLDFTVTKDVFGEKKVRERESWPARARGSRGRARAPSRG